MGRWWQGLGVFLVACSPPTLNHTIPPGARAAWLALDAAGQAISAGLVAPRGSEVRLELSRAAELALFTIPPAAIIDPSGPLGQEQLASLIAVGANHRGETEGSCGRCLAPSEVWPMPLLPGDSCRLPRAAEGQLFELDGAELVPSPAMADRLDALRGLLLIEAPGPCACVGPGPVSLEGVRFDPRPFAEAPVPLRAPTEDDAGRIWGFLPEQLWRFDPATGTSVFFSDPLPEATLPVASVALADGAVLVSRIDPSLRYASTRLDRLAEVEGQLQADPVLVDTEARINVLRRPPLDPLGRVFAGGDVRALQQRFAALFSCDAEGRRCASEALESTQLSAIEDVQVLANGVGHALTETGVYTQAMAGGVWNYVDLQQSLTLGSTPARLTDVLRMVFGDRIAVGCGVLEPAGRVLFRVPYQPDGRVDSSALEVVHYELGFGFSCGALAREDGPPEGFLAAIGLAGGWRGTVELDAEGRLRNQRAQAPVSVPASALYRLERGSYYARDQGGGFYWGATPAQLLRRYGPADPNPGWTMTVLQGGPNRAIAVTSRGRLRVIDEAEARAVPDPEGLVPGDAEFAGATLDPSHPGPAERMVLVGPKGVAALTFGATVESFAWLASDLRNGSGVAYASPGRFVVATTDGLLHSYGLEGTKPIELRLSDPEPGETVQASMVSRAGVVWAASDEGGLARGVGTEFQMQPIEDRGVVFRDLSVACPDQVLGAAGMPLGFGVVQVRPDASGALLAQFSLAPISATAIRTAVPDGEGLALFDESGFIFRPNGTTGTFPLWTPVLRSLSLPHLVVLGGLEGMIFVGRR